MKDEFYNRVFHEDSLSLATGWIKLCSWGVAIVCNDESTPLTFSTVNTRNDLSGLYRWEDSIPAHFRAGPSRLAMAKTNVSSYADSK
jgi:hypothetical protein